MGVNPWVLGVAASENFLKKVELIGGTPEAAGLKSIGITVFFVQTYLGMKYSEVFTATKTPEKSAFGKRRLLCLETHHFQVNHLFNFGGVITKLFRYQCMFTIGMPS